MKCKKVILAIVFLTAMSVAAPLAFSQSGGNRVVDSFISAQAAKEGGEEYEKARKTVRGDVNKDGKQDLIVLYTLEGFGGGNNYIQYLAVFLGNGKTFRYAANDGIGGKNSRAIDLLSVTGGKINLRTTKYGKNDPSCCPSIKGRTAFVLRNGKLKEV